MSFPILEEHGGRNLLINVRGKLAKEDYKEFVKEFEQHFGSTASSACCST